MKSRLERLEEMYDYLIAKGMVLNKKDLSIKMRMNSQSTISRAFAGNERYLTDAFLEKFNNAFGNVFSPEWLATGNGNMLACKDEKVASFVLRNKSIPLDNLGNEEAINVDNIFPLATSAIVYNDDAINEYQRGTIFVLRQLKNTNIVPPCKMCCIETDNYKIIRIVQQEKDTIVAYGTNDAKYPDGSLVYPPIHIPLDEINKLSVVIGAVIKF